MGADLVLVSRTEKRLEKMAARLGEGDPGEAIRLTYAGDGVRLVPVLQAFRIWRYGAEPDAVTLDRLDGSSWRKRKDEVEAAVAETAKGLAELAEARRRIRLLEQENEVLRRAAAYLSQANLRLGQSPK